MGTALAVLLALATDPVSGAGASAPKNSFTGERFSVMSMKTSKSRQTIPWFDKGLAPGDENVGI
jgi:hypothetical protein